MICDLNENYCTIQGLIYISKPRRSFLRRLSRNDSILDSIRLWYNQYNAWRNDECSIVDCFVRSYTNGSLDRRMKDGTMPRGIVHSAGGERDQTESSDTATPPHPWRQRTSDPLRIRAEFRVVFFFLRGFLDSPIGGSGEGWRFYNRRRKGKFAARANCAVRARALKRVLLPTFGNPIKPTLGVTHNWVVVIVVELVQEEERARDTEKASEPPSCPLCVVWLLVE